MEGNCWIGLTRTSVFLQCFIFPFFRRIYPWSTFPPAPASQRHQSPALLHLRLLGICLKKLCLFISHLSLSLARSFQKQMLYKVSLQVSLQQFTTSQLSHSSNYFQDSEMWDPCRSRLLGCAKAARGSWLMWNLLWSIPEGLALSLSVHMYLYSLI